MSEENKNAESNVSTQPKPLRLVPLHLMRSRENFWKLAVVVLLLVVSWFNIQMYYANQKKAQMIIKHSQPLKALDSENPELMGLADEQANELREFFAANERGAAPMLNETPEKITLRIFVPFLNKYELDAEENSGRLTINGSAAIDKKAKTSKSAVETQVSHNFAYSIPLPADAELKKLKMDRTANVLTVTIPRKNVQAKASPEVKPTEKTEAKPKEQAAVKPVVKK
jgi:HSP20 family molecular chaperone IbpA